jgi:hypothetical protein
VGLLCAEKRIKNKEDLTNVDFPLNGSVNYKNALRFADENLQTTLQGYEQIITDRIEQKRQEQEHREKREDLSLFR